MPIAENLKTIRSKLPQKVRLIAVTKNQPSESVDELIEHGVTDIGENRVQEARDKFPRIKNPAPLTRHLIGHLQSNKAKYAVKLFDMIHSVDSVALAEALEKEAAKINRTIPILLQVNISNDPNKHGFQAQDVDQALKTIRATCPHLPVEGLMTIVLHEEIPENTRPYFKALRELRDRLGLKELSMGMSHDYPIALEEGATMVRIGSALFA